MIDITVEDLEYLDDGLYRLLVLLREVEDNLRLLELDKDIPDSEA